LVSKEPTGVAANTSTAPRLIPPADGGPLLYVDGAGAADLGRSDHRDHGPRAGEFFRWDLFFSLRKVHLGGSVLDRATRCVCGKCPKMWPDPFFVKINT
jgi:hypothetical protein